MASGSPVDRRQILKGLAVAPMLALAGCGGQQNGDGGGGDGGGGDGGGGDGGGGDGGGGDGGGGDGGGQDLGERVPTLVLDYISGQAGREVINEQMSSFTAEDLGQLGIDVKVQGTPLAESVAKIIEDTHETDYWVAISTSSPDRIDPQEWLLRYSINSAGSGGLNLSNWPNCDYSELALQQDEVAPDQRRDLVDQALNIVAEEYAVIPLFGEVDFSVARLSTVDADGIGNAGFTPVNPMSLVKSSPAEGDTLFVSENAEGLQRKNWAVIPQGPTFSIWNNLIYSPPTMYNENYEIVNSLASSMESSDDATQVVMELADGTFHNGEPITAEHVKFTYEFINDNRETVYKATEVPYESIEIVDDKTVEFNFTEPYPIAVNREFAAFGVLYKDQWEEADGDVGGFNPDDIVGSGPFRLENFRTDQDMTLVPHDGHPTLSADHRIVFRGFQGEQSAVQAFQAGELDLLTLVSPSSFSRLEGGDDVQGYSSLGMYPGPGVYPQASHGPNKFKEFRQAAGTAINRQRMNQVVLFDRGSPQTHPLYITQEHPWFPDDLDTVYTDDPSGEPERARQILEDAGWGWDDNGRLHYPPDADTSPLWEASGVPGQDDFPCVNSEGDFAQ